MQRPPVYFCLLGHEFAIPFLPDISLRAIGARPNVGINKSYILHTLLNVDIYKSYIFHTLSNIYHTLIYFYTNTRHVRHTFTQ
jgi:hypothetical protein